MAVTSYLSASLSKTLLGHRSRMPAATPVTSGCVYNKDESDRPVSMRETHLPASIPAAHGWAPGGRSLSVRGCREWPALPVPTDERGLQTLL